jgi:hypothetical protein
MPEGRRFSKTVASVCENANFKATSMALSARLVGHVRTACARAFAPTSLPVSCGVMTTLSPRDQAAQDAAALVAHLRTLAPGPVVTELAALGEHLERAIRAFHMEAIRFRAYTMSRLIKQHHDALPVEVQTRMDGILHSLEAAGFQTRSVTA